LKWFEKKNGRHIEYTDIGKKNHGQKILLPWPFYIRNQKSAKPVAYQRQLSCSPRAVGGGHPLGRRDPGQLGAHPPGDHYHLAPGEDSHQKTCFFLWIFDTEHGQCAFV
jgi:hypothetical protein